MRFVFIEPRFPDNQKCFIKGRPAHVLDLAAIGQAFRPNRIDSHLHENSDELRRMLDHVGQTVKVHAR